VSNPYHYPPHPLLPLHILTTELVRLHDVAAVSEVTLTATALMFNARAAALWLVDPDERVLCLLNRRGARQCAWPDSLPLDADHPLVDVVRNRATVYIPDTSIAPHCIFHDQPLPHAQLAVPLMVGARPLGVLYLDHAQVAPFGEQERMLLDTMANTAAIVLENALLFEKAHQAEARYRAIAELTSDYAYSIRVEPDGVLVTESVTESISRITGFTSQELDAHGWAILIHPDDRPIALRRVASLPPGRADVSEFRIVTKTGETRYVRDHRRPVWDEVQQRVVRIDGAAQDITERKRAEEALARLSHHNELILNSAGEGIFGLDSQGRHTFVNVAAARMLGYEVEELVGQRSHPVWHHSRPDGRPYPDDECPIYAAYRDGVTHYGTDDVFWRKDGTCFPVEYVSTPIREEDELAGAVVVFRDVTERRRAEEALARLSHHNELILNSAGEGIFGLDSQGRHTFVNVAAARMLGYEVEELIGEHSHPIWHHSKSDGSPYPLAECPMDAAYCDGIVHRVADEVFWRKDGTSFPVEYVSTPIHERGQLIGAVVVFRDMTERRRAEQQAILAERMAALGRLAAALAHEINNPLQAIQSHLELVMDFPLEPDE